MDPSDVNGKLGTPRSLIVNYSNNLAHFERYIVSKWKKEATNL